MTYYISEDNVNFTLFGSVDNTLDPKINSTLLLDFTSQQTTKKARYVKVIALKTSVNYPNGIKELVVMRLFLLMK